MYDYVSIADKQGKYVSLGPPGPTLKVLHDVSQMCLVGVISNNSNDHPLRLYLHLIK